MAKRRASLVTLCLPQRSRLTAIFHSQVILAMEIIQTKRYNYLSIGKPFDLGAQQALTYPWVDGGVSGLPALYIIDEMGSRMQFDLKLDDEILLCRHFDLITGMGRGG